MNVTQSIQSSFSKSLIALKERKGIAYILIFILALVAFEAFNFSTTEYALSDLLGELRFIGIRWSTLLAVAFCGIDFAGIARLFTPQTGKDEPRSVWYVFGAWILAATMNAILTWWGVVMAMQTHPVLSAGVVDAGFVSKSVPIFIALMVWVIRIFLIGTFSRKGDRMLQEAMSPTDGKLSRRELRQAQSRAAHPKPASASLKMGFKPSSTAKSLRSQKAFRPDPTYIPMQEEAAFHSFKSSKSGQRRG